MIIAATALVARSIGQKAHLQARQQATAGMLLTTIVQACIAAFIVGFRHDLLALVRAPDDTAALAARYLAMTLPSMPIMAIGIISSAVLPAHGRGRKAMYMILLTGTISCLIDPYIIFHLQWGLDGKVLALVLSRGGVAGMTLWLVIRRYPWMARPDWPALTALLNPFFTIDLPTMLAQITTTFVNYVMTNLISVYGDSAVAAWVVVSRLTIVAFGRIFALSSLIIGIFLKISVLASLIVCARPIGMR